MNKKWIFVTIAIAVALAIGGGVVMANVDGHEPVSTDAIDLTDCFPAGVAEAKPASFEPVIDRDTAISIARDMLRDGFGLSSPETLETTATLAVFSGQAHDGRGTVSDVHVWVVIVKDIPITLSGGPRGDGESSAHYRPGKPQFNVALDASTGAVVHSVMSGDVIPAADAPN